MKAVVNFFVLVFFFSACEIINPEEDLPAYIHIPELMLTTVESKQGANTHNICDVWLNVDGELIGVFELPVTCPVLKTGMHTLTIRAGIKDNGIAASRTPYPFYSKYKINKKLIAQKIDTLSPEITYDDELNFDNLWLEDFDDMGLTLETTEQSDVPVQLQTDSTGNRFMQINLDTSDAIFEFKTINSKYLPFDRPVYLELDYKNDHAFIAGVFANKTDGAYQIPVININPVSEWSKIYINLTNTMASNRTIFFVINRSLYENNTDALICIDNIKLIYYE